MTAPATPAPADGAPGERVSVDAAALNELDTATLRGDSDMWTTDAARRLIDSARPLPSREAVEAAVDAVCKAHETAAYRNEKSEFIWTDWTQEAVDKEETARAALLALVFGDSAPGEDGTR